MILTWAELILWSLLAFCLGGILGSLLRRASFDEPERRAGPPGPPERLAPTECAGTSAPPLRPARS